MTVVLPEPLGVEEVEMREVRFIAMVVLVVVRRRC